jgi:hypothetical protein
MFFINRMEGLMSGSDHAVPTVQIAAGMPRPRIIKTHLHDFLLPDEIWAVKPKVI